MTEEIKVVFSRQAAGQMEDQAMVDDVTAALQAFANGDPLPDGVEISVAAGGAGVFDEDDIADVIGSCPGLPAAERERLQAAMRSGDMEVFAEIIMAAQEGGATH